MSKQKISKKIGFEDIICVDMMLTSFMRTLRVYHPAIIPDCDNLQRIINVKMLCLVHNKSESYDLRTCFSFSMSDSFPQNAFDIIPLYYCIEIKICSTQNFEKYNRFFEL